MRVLRASARKTRTNSLLASAEGARKQGKPRRLNSPVFTWVTDAAEHPNIVGIKDSSGNVAKITQIVANVPETFHAFVGSASNLLPALVVGAVGAVAALANVFPHEVSMLQALFEADEMVEARALQARLIPANSAVTTIFGVAGLKAALEMTVGYGGKPRLPLQPLGEQERAKLFSILHMVPQDE